VAKKITRTERAKANCADDRSAHRLARFLSWEKGDVKHLKGTDPPKIGLRLGEYLARFYDHGNTI
jgi:hypothetical protein